MARIKASLPALLLFGATLAIALKTIGEVRLRAGHAGAPLDDAYIHFQYARAIVEGHPLRYQAGEPISTGATSVLWPLLLAPFYAVGFRDSLLVWPAWALSFASLGLLAWEAGAVVRPLAGRTAAIASGALVLSFGGLVWCAASGMEVVPFAWVIFRTVRRAAEWSEGERSRNRLLELLALSNAATLLRPEGAVIALATTLLLLAYGTSPTRDKPSLGARALALTALAIPVTVTLILRRVSGSALTNTAVAKLLFLNPYNRGPVLRQAIIENLHTFFRLILNGDTWSAEFIPASGATVALLGLAALAGLAVRRRLFVRGALLLLLAACMLIPCFYTTFLWNRLRYLWPFSPAWMIGLACLAHVIGSALGRYVPGARAAEALIAGAFVGLFASKLPWVIDDVAQSVSGIDRQQVAAGRWARHALPESARIGINDAGAIAYFGGHRTFDVVGLTTSGEARYWLAGVGSRFEHYEKLSRDRLPSHFIVYPEWFAADALLGRTLAEFTVTDATILGGRTKRACLADWSLLGSGELPWSESVGAIVDSVDVADLESEAAHEYALGDAREGEQILRAAPVPNATARWADGGRTDRMIERFFVRLSPGVEHRVVIRLESANETHVKLVVGGNASEAAVPGGGAWTEIVLPIPSVIATPSGRVAVELTAAEPITTFHYWFAAR
jgi:hypothetical protein